MCGRKFDYIRNSVNVVFVELRQTGRNESRFVVRNVVGFGIVLCAYGDGCSRVLRAKDFKRQERIKVADFKVLYRAYALRFPYIVRASRDKIDYTGNERVG